MKDVFLGIELSSNKGSVAVGSEAGLLFEAEFGAGRSHNALLFEPLREALLKAGQRLAGIVVGTGPGSYTGVRIGIAAAQGVALSRQVPVAGVSSLLAWGREMDFGVVGDARRGRVYVACVRAGWLQEPIVLTSPEQLSEVRAATGLTRWVSCDAVAPLPELERVQPSARWLVERACKGGVDWDSVQPLEPHYLEGAFITKPRS